MAASLRVSLRDMSLLSSGARASYSLILLSSINMSTSISNNTAMKAKVILDGKGVSFNLVISWCYSRQWKYSIFVSHNNQRRQWHANQPSNHCLLPLEIFYWKSLLIKMVIQLTLSAILTSCFHWYSRGYSHLSITELMICKEAGFLMLLHGGHGDVYGRDVNPFAQDEAVRPRPKSSRVSRFIVSFYVAGIVDWGDIPVRGRKEEPYLYFGCTVIITIHLNNDYHASQFT